MKCDLKLVVDNLILLFTYHSVVNTITPLTNSLVPYKPAFSIKSKGQMGSANAQLRHDEALFPWSLSPGDGETTGTTVETST